MQTIQSLTTAAAICLLTLLVPEAGNALTFDRDGDGAADSVDNCPYVYNPNQTDNNSDGFGDACECATPLYAFTGSGAVDLLGASVTGVGDANQDGYDDYIVGTDDGQPAFRRLLEAFFARTGVPVVLNTSFNVRGEPIVRTPDEALACFDRTGMDLLVLGDRVVEKA